MGKAFDIPDESAQGEGDDFPDAAQAHDGKQLRFGQHLLRDEAAPVLALLVGMAQFRQEDFDHLPLTRRPLPRFANQRLDLPGLGQASARFEPHAIVTEVRAQPRLHLRGAFGGLAVSVEPIPPFLGFGVGHPDLFGCAGQVGLADAHRADLVVVSVRLLKLTHLATLQDLGLAPGGGQRAHHLEAVARSLQHDQILGGGVLLGPTRELSHRHLVEGFLDLGGCGRGAVQDRRGEAVRVSVKADHPLDKF